MKRIGIVAIGAIKWSGEGKNDKPYYKMLETRHAESDEAVVKHDPQWILGDEYVDYFLKDIPFRNGWEDYYRI